MNKNFELLAPAGSYEAFLAAVENGADAVYLGGKLFNARANATNFEIEELEKMVIYAHLRGVKIYITMNTLLEDNEVKEALDFAYRLYEIGIDAVIVQDLGLAKVLHTYIPELPLHASTQMTVYNLQGVKELEKLGFARVVLARELSLAEIKEICEHTSMEIEIFVHGALCVCYSGQCLMSSMIGDRSGNRGKCAQPCRLPYQLLEDGKPVAKGYLLSPKDLSAIDLLQQLPHPLSLKIEGRMKSPEYVATVVSHYRKMIEMGSLEKEEKQELAQIFNRGGFTTAYWEAKQGASMMCYEKPKNWGIYVGKVTNYDGKKFITLEDASTLHIGDGIEVWNGEENSPSTIVSEIIGNKVGRIQGKIHVGDKVYKTSDKKLNQQARESFSRGFVKKSDVSLHIIMKENTPVKIKINDWEYVSNIVPQEAKSKPLTKETVETQFLKTGNTPFRIGEMKIDLAENIFLTLAELNEIRRDAFLQYEEMLIRKIPRTITHKEIELPESKKKLERKVSLFLHDWKQEYQNIPWGEIDRVYLPIRLFLAKDNFPIPVPQYAVLPAITKKNYDRFITKNIKSIATKVEGFILSNISQLSYLQGIHTKKIANENFQIFNSYTIQQLQELGIDEVTLSPELTKEQINALHAVLPCELKVYGKQCVMISEYCVIGSTVGKFSNHQKCLMPCKNGKKYFLQDRKKEEFLVVPDSIDCQSHIYNSKITSITSKNLFVDSIRIDVMEENVAKINEIIQICKEGEKLSGEQYTNGHIVRPV